MTDFYYYLSFIYLFIQIHHLYDTVSFKKELQEVSEQLEEVTGVLKSKNIIIQKSTLFKALKTLLMLSVDISKLVFCYWWILFGIKHSMESYYFISILSIYIIKFIINMFLFIKKIKQGGGFLTMIMGGGMSRLMSKEAQPIKNPLKSGDLYFTISKIFIVLIILYLHFNPFN